MDYSDHHSDSKKNKYDEEPNNLFTNNLLNGSPRWENALAETRNK